MNLVDICTGIRGITKEEDIRVLIETINAHTRYLAQRKAMQFNIGQRVKWRSKKRRGMIMTGTIRSFGPKNIKVHADGFGLWTVHPSLLSPVE